MHIVFCLRVTFRCLRILDIEVVSCPPWAKNFWSILQAMNLISMGCQVNQHTVAGAACCERVALAPYRTSSVKRGCHGLESCLALHYAFFSLLTIFWRPISFWFEMVSLPAGVLSLSSAVRGYVVILAADKCAATGCAPTLGQSGHQFCSSHVPCSVDGVFVLTKCEVCSG